MARLPPSQTRQPLTLSAFASLRQLPQRESVQKSTLLGDRQQPPTDTHALAEEIHHKPELARKIISDVVAEQHGVAMIAEELAKNEMAAASVVDELMKHPAVADAIADRCAAAKIQQQVGREDSSSKR